jgi:hypothetical protein
VASGTCSAGRVVLSRLQGMVDRRGGRRECEGKVTRVREKLSWVMRSGWLRVIGWGVTGPDGHGAMLGTK